MTATVARLPRFGTYWVAWSILLGCGVTVVSTLVYFAWGTAPRTVRISEIIGGTGNRVLVDQTPIQVGAIVSPGQQIVTLPEARVGLQQAQQGVVRLGGQSAAILESDCIQLGDGQMVVSSTAGCLGAAVVTSPTGIFVLERVGTLGEVKVLAGEVTLTIPSNPTLGTITLETNQKLTLSLTGDEIGPVRLMLPAEVNRLVTGDLFQGFQQAIANQSAIAGFPPLAPPPPRKPLVITQPPADKVPAAAPSTPAPEPRPAATMNLPTSRIEANGQDEADEAPPLKSVSNYPPRSLRRRRYTAPADEVYPTRRKWSRSPASSTYSRRRPVYSPPAAAPSPHPAPAIDLPPVPELTVPELPNPMELPPATLPAPSDRLPEPVLVEPPLSAPNPQ